MFVCKGGQEAACKLRSKTVHKHKDNCFCWTIFHFNGRQLRLVPRTVFMFFFCCCCTYIFIFGWASVCFPSGTCSIHAGLFLLLTALLILKSDRLLKEVKGGAACTCACRWYALPEAALKGLLLRFTPTTLMHIYLSCSLQWLVKSHKCLKCRWTDPAVMRR